MRYVVTSTKSVDDVCNPQQAARVLTADIGRNVALPCRIELAITRMMDAAR